MAQRTRTLRLITTLALLGSPVARGQMPDPPGQVAPGGLLEHESYLFAHIMEGDHGRLCYGIGLDGLAFGGEARR